MTRLVLLDRDGVLNEDLPGGVTSPDALRLIPGAGEAVGRLRAAEFRIAVVSNQSVVGKGLVTPPELEAIHARLRALLEADGAGTDGGLDALFHCSAAPATASWQRKPNPGMLLAALARFGARPEHTPMVGDALRDLEAAVACGCPAYLVRTGKGAATWDKGLPSHIGTVTVGDDLHDLAPRLIAAYS